MTDDLHYDVVIIGTGAGGGTLGHRLARRAPKPTQSLRPTGW